MPSAAEPPRSRADLAPVIIAARRSPIGTAGGRLAGVPLEGLAGPVLAAARADTGLDTVDEVMLGNVMGPGGNVARVCALAAGLGVGVTGLTVDRQCGSGLEAVHLAATMVATGRAQLVLAGGVESPSTAPTRLARPTRPGEAPVAYDRAPFAPAGFADPDMGVAAEQVSGGITRDRQDAYAARSHARAVATADAGGFAAEIVPVAGVDRDERPRRGFGVHRLARFPAAFTPGGSVTAANSCGINDGAAVLAVVPEHVRRRLGLPGLRIRDWAVTGCDPGTPGLGPVAAVTEVLTRGGLSAGDLGVVEFTEAFAGQVLACLDPLGIDPDIVCPGGGAIALGHPWGASGAICLVRLFTAMVRTDGLRVGLATLGVGGGMGMATLVERVG